MKTYAEQVAERLVKYGQSLYGNAHGWKTKFAIALEMDLQSLNPYLKGERLPGNVLQARLRNYLNGPVEWILYGEEKDKKQSAESFIAVMSVPVYSHVNAGTKTWVVSDEIVEYIGVPKRSDDTLKGLIVKGQSMAPEISDGDVVVISEKAEVRKNDLCVVEFNDGERCLRRVLIEKGNAVLSSNKSDEYPTMIVPQSKIRALYRVMQYIRKY